MKSEGSLFSLPYFVVTTVAGHNTPGACSLHLSSSQPFSVNFIVMSSLQNSIFIPCLRCVQCLLSAYCISKDISRLFSLEYIPNHFSHLLSWSWVDR